MRIFKFWLIFATTKKKKKRKRLDEAGSLVISIDHTGKFESFLQTARLVKSWLDSLGGSGRSGSRDILHTSVVYVSGWSV